jgi:hypothetical protein
MFRLWKILSAIGADLPADDHGDRRIIAPVASLPAYRNLAARPEIDAKQF